MQKASSKDKVSRDVRAISRNYIISGAADQSQRLIILLRAVQLSATMSAEDCHGNMEQ